MALQLRRPVRLASHEDGNGLDVHLEPPGSSCPRVRRIERLSLYIQEVYYDLLGPLGKPARYLRPDPTYPGGYGGPYGRPYGAYNRPCGYSYGGGMGMMPLAGPLFGGLLLGGMAGGALSCHSC